MLLHICVVVNPRVARAFLRRSKFLEGRGVCVHVSGTKGRYEGSEVGAGVGILLGLKRVADNET